MQSKVVDGFLPSTAGFAFTNRFPSGIPVREVAIPGTGLSVPLGDASNGVCGGMVYAALDLFLASPRLRRPADTVPPAADSPITSYVVDRLVDSFALREGVDSNVARYLSLMSTPDKTAWFVHGVARVIADHEWPAIKADIDAGRPSPLGLVAGHRTWVGDVIGKLSTLGHCHQVLAYGYTLDDHDLLTLRVYDPNDPGNDTSTIAVSLADPDDANPIATPRISARISGHASFRAFFRHDHYQPVRPPAGVSPGPIATPVH